MFDSGYPLLPQGTHSSLKLKTVMHESKQAAGCPCTHRELVDSWQHLRCLCMYPHQGECCAPKPTHMLSYDDSEVTRDIVHVNKYDTSSRVTASQALAGCPGLSSSDHARYLLCVIGFFFKLFLVILFFFRLVFLFQLHATSSHARSIFDVIVDRSMHQFRGVGRRVQRHL